MPTPTDYPAGWFAPKQAWHFLRRLWERERLMLEAGDYQHLVRQITCGAAHDLRWPYPIAGRGLYVAYLRGRPLFVVAGPRGLITVYPRADFRVENGKWRMTVAALKAAREAKARKLFSAESAIPMDQHAHCG